MENINVPPAANPPTTQPWTPELILQAFKEGVTALLGLILVFGMVYLAWKTYALANLPIDDKNIELMRQRLTWAKDILVLMLGPAGVVLGYYFGRVPADARAVQAQKQADTATAHAQQVSAQAEVAATQAEKLIGTAPLAQPDPSGTRSAGNSRGVSENDLQRLRDELRHLARLARTLA